MKSDKMKALLIEDNRWMAEGIAQILRQRQFAVDIVDNGLDGLEYACSGQYDIVLLDVLLPKMHGFEVARQIRLANISTPVLMLTAKEEIVDKVRGLDCGADDYMTKPFDKDELLARIRALTRRTGSVLSETAEIGDLSLNLADHSLSAGNKRVALNYKEFEIMRILALNLGGVVSKEQLLSKVWGLNSNAEDNNVEAYISFLRNKLKFLSSGVRIVTIRKTGYYLSAGDKPPGQP